MGDSGEFANLAFSFIQQAQLVLQSNSNGKKVPGNERDYLLLKVYLVDLEKYRRQEPDTLPNIEANSDVFFETTLDDIRRNNYDIAFFSFKWPDRKVKIYDPREDPDVVLRLLQLPNTYVYLDIMCNVRSASIDAMPFLPFFSEVILQKTFDPAYYHSLWCVFERLAGTFSAFNAIRTYADRFYGCEQVILALQDVIQTQILIDKYCSEQRMVNNQINFPEVMKHWEARKMAFGKYKQYKYLLRVDKEDYLRATSAEEYTRDYDVLQIKFYEPTTSFLLQTSYVISTVVTLCLDEVLHQLERTNVYLIRTLARPQAELESQEIGETRDELIRNREMAQKLYSILLKQFKTLWGAKVYGLKNDKDEDMTFSEMVMEEVKPKEANQDRDKIEFDGSLEDRSQVKKGFLKRLLNI